MAEELWEQVAYGDECVHGVPIGTPGGADLMCPMCEDGLTRWVDDTWTEVHVYWARLDPKTGALLDKQYDVRGARIRTGMNRPSIDEYEWADDINRRTVEKNDPDDPSILLVGYEALPTGEWVCPTCDDNRYTCSWHRDYGYQGRTR